MSKFDKTHAKSIGEIITDYNQIRVPQFQRDYSWDAIKGKAQTLELWNDLSNKFLEWLDDDEISIDYLIGPMVFIENKKENQLEIVDGQQRLATLTMILAIIRDVYHELNTDPSSYDFEDEYLNEIYDLIERRKQNSDNTHTHQNWRIQLNTNDEKKFIEYVQQYRPNKLGEEIAQPGDVFRKITDKIKFLKKELKDNKELKVSHQKIIKSYLYLYDEIMDALFSRFKKTADADSLSETIHLEAVIQIDQVMRKTPKDYGLPSEFFIAPKTGLDIFENESWTDDEKKEIELEYKMYLNKSKRATKTLDEWKAWKIDQIKDKKNSDGVSYKDIREEEIEKLIHEKKISKWTKNLGTLLSFGKYLIQKKLFSVRIIVENEEDAYEIFETVNARGEPLSKANLLKNYILKQISSDKDKNDYSKKWDDIIADLSNRTLPDDFLRESLRSRGWKDPKTDKFYFESYPIQNSYDKKIKLSKDNLYKVIKFNYEILQTTEEKNDYAIYYIDKILTDDLKLSNLLDDPITNLSATVSSSDLSNPRPALIDLMNLDAKYIRLPIMCAYRKWRYESNEFVILVKFLVPFFFRYKTIREKNTTKLESLMLKICEKIQNGTDAKSDLSIIIKFLLQYDDEEEFQNTFLPSLEDPSRNLAKFVLQHIETQLSTPYDDVEAIDGLEIEHILPQNPELKDKDPKNNWIESDFVLNHNSDIHRSLPRFSSWHNKIGNLTFLRKAINSTIKNKSFLVKRDYKDSSGKDEGYRSSKLQINKETVVKIESTTTERSEWTVNSIYERGIYFSCLAQIIWALPKIICSNSSCKYHHGHRLDNIEIGSIDETHCSNELCKQNLQLEWSTAQIGTEYKIPNGLQI